LVTPEPENAGSREERSVRPHRRPLPTMETRPARPGRPGSAASPARRHRRLPPGSPRLVTSRPVPGGHTHPTTASGRNEGTRKGMVTAVVTTIEVLITRSSRGATVVAKRRCSRPFLGVRHRPTRVWPARI